MDTIIVTNWETVEKDDFYLSKDWIENAGKETMKEARRLQRTGNLFVAYEVSAKSYALYSQMDALQIFIDENREIIMSCAGAVVSNDHRERWEGEDY